MAAKQNEICAAASPRSIIERIRFTLRHRRISAFGHLLTGTSANVVLSLLSMVLVARELGPQQYGVFALILTLGQATERLLSFQSWQPLIRYGAALDLVANRDDLRSLFKFGLLLDLSGSLAACATASLLAVAAHFLFAAPWLNVGIALIYTSALPFNMSGTATAAFRLSDHYRTIARLQIVGGLARLAAVIAVFAVDAGLMGFVLIWSLTKAFGYVLNILVALQLMKRRGISQIVRASIAGMSKRFPDLWRFTWGANFSLTIWASAQQLDTLIVGWLADPASAGLFHIAKRVSRILQQLGSQVESVVYPDLSRLWGTGSRSAFARLVIQTELILASFGGFCFLASMLLAEPVLTLTAGARFAGAAPLLTVQILAVALTISGAGARAGLLAMGDQAAILWTVLAASTSFYLSVGPLIARMGAMGANGAHVLFGFVWLSGLTLSLRMGLRRTTSARSGSAVAE